MKSGTTRYEICGIHLRAWRRDGFSVKEVGRIDQRAAYQREYYQRNKAKLAAAKREYYQRNKENVAAAKREYRARNKAKLAAYHRDYYQRNKAKLARRNAA